MCKAAGMDDGQFCVRTKEGSSILALCVVFKGKPTHHMIDKNEDGVMTVNKKAFGDFTDVESVRGHPDRCGPFNRPRSRIGVEMYGRVKYIAK
jgi:hypothetical protein